MQKPPAIPPGSFFAYATLLLQLEGAGDGEVDVVADRRQVLLHAEISTRDEAGRFEAHRVSLIQRVDARTAEMRLERDRLGDAVQREIALDGGRALAGRRDLGRREGRSGKFRGVEPLIAFQLLVEH